VGRLRLAIPLLVTSEVESTARAASVLCAYDSRTRHKEATMAMTVQNYFETLLEKCTIKGCNEQVLATKVTAKMIYGLDEPIVSTTRPSHCIKHFQSFQAFIEG
jgi:hypothetical protein